MSARHRRLASLEQRHGTTTGTDVADMTDHQLESIICQGTGLTPDDLTDETLTKIANGEEITA